MVKDSGTSMTDVALEPLCTVEEMTDLERLKD